MGDKFSFWPADPTVENLPAIYTVVDPGRSKYISGYVRYDIYIDPGRSKYISGYVRYDTRVDFPSAC